MRGVGFSPRGGRAVLHFCGFLSVAVPQSSLAQWDATCRSLLADFDEHVSTITPHDRVVAEQARLGAEIACTHGDVESAEATLRKVYELSSPASAE